MKTTAEVLEAMYAGRMLVFGHSGAQAYAPGNTMPAFELALQQGADGVELDVHRSADGHPVIIHDFTVDSATDGQGIVSEMTLAQLRELDAGSSFSPAFAGTRIPTLDEVFDAVGHKLYVNVEIKSMSQHTDGVEQVVADCIVRHAMQERVVVSCFNPLALHRFRTLLPTVPIGFLYGLDSPEIVHSLLGDLAYEAYHPQVDLVDEALVQRAASARQWINVWTVNDPAKGVRLRDLGVHGIITDAPDKMLAALHDR